jgi:AraC-like DNA-binding protein
METAESFLRVAGIVVTLLMAVLLLRDAGRSLVGRLAAVFSVGVAAYLVCSSSTFHSLSPSIHLPILALCVNNPVLFWLLARALFDDGFRIAPAHGLIVVAFLVLKSVEVLAGGLIAAVSEMVLHAAGFALAAHALWVAYRGRADDLSEERRAFRLPFVIGVGVFSLILVVAETILGGAIPSAPVRVIPVAIIAALALASALRLIALQGDELLVPSAPAKPATAAIREDEADAGDLARLNDLMEREQVWCQEGLTIGKLADQVGVPEYRLRRLINKALGHRNFAAYLNGYRIEAAKAALSDAARRRLPVLTIALDLGFGSIGPFNRAFKEATGMTPTEFRRAHLGGGQNDLAES